MQDVLVSDECMGCFAPGDRCCCECQGGLCAKCASGHVCQGRVISLDGDEYEDRAAATRQNAYEHGFDDEELGRR